MDAPGEGLDARKNFRRVKGVELFCKGCFGCVGASSCFCFCWVFTETFSLAADQLFVVRTAVPSDCTDLLTPLDFYITYFFVYFSS